MKKHLKNTIGNQYSLYTFGIILVFFLWYIMSTTIGSGNYYFPSPIETIQKTGELLTTKYIWRGIGWTLLRTLIGFGIAALSALILGSLAGNYKSLRIILKPLVLVFKSVPTATFVFVFLVLSGSRYAPVYIVFLISFPILYESIVGGISNIPQEILESVRLDTKDFFVTVIKIKLPLAVPYIIIGLTSSFALSLKTEIMAEIITGDTNYGLGCAISAYRHIDPSDMTPIFGIALIALTFVLIVDLVGLIIKKKITLYY